MHAGHLVTGKFPGQFIYSYHQS